MHSRSCAVMHGLLVGLLLLLLTSGNAIPSSISDSTDPTLDPSSAPSVGDFPVDFVYTWVNGSDPEWYQHRLLNAKNIDNTVASDSNVNLRFRDHDELRFSLRSINTYAPWARNIFIVTCCGQKPSWLKDNSKVKIIDHTEIIPSTIAKGTTYNSFSIETWVNRIPGLSEQFVLMNDDFFIGGKLDKTDLFDIKGRPKVAFQKDWGVNTVPPPNKDDAYLWAAYNCDLLLNQVYHSEERFKILHQAYPVTKGLYRRVHELFAERVSETTAHQFRTRSDIIPHFLAMWIGVYERTAIRLADEQFPSNKYLRMVDDSLQNKHVLLDMLAHSGETKLFCVGDHMQFDDADRKTTSYMSDFFKAYYPLKPEWEM